MAHLGDRGRSGPGCDHKGFSGPELLDAAGMDLELIAAPAGAPATRAGSKEPLLGLLGRHPRRFRPRHRGQQLGGLRHVLTMRDDGLHIPERLLSERSVADALQVRQLLGAQDQAHAGRTSAAEEPRDLLRGDC